MTLSRACLALALVAPPALCAAQYQLVWSDEFDGTAIDASKWTHEVNGWGGGNNELQYYTARPVNSFVDDGNLVIRAIKESYTGPDGTRQYTSARLNTRYKGDWLYGRIEARAKLPIGQGLWPAIWMLPSDYVYGGWAASGEIDIMEYRGNEPDKVLGTIHYGGPWPANVYSGEEYVGPNFSEDFHVFSVEWEPTEIRWYVDGVLFGTRTSWYSTGGAYPAPFDERFHLLLNVAVGGNFLPNPPPDADYFPQEMTVDWVRVYQLPVVQEPYEGTPSAVPGRVQAEGYDTGGSTVAYFDLTGGNTGNALRTDDVDIEACTDAGGGHNVGWVQPNEWLEYTLDVQTAGTYEPRVRVASAGSAGTLRLRFLDTDGDEIAVSNASVGLTGGWQTWTTVVAPEVALPSGAAILRAEIVSGEYNVNYVDLDLIAPAPVDLDAWVVE